MCQITWRSTLCMLRPNRAPSPPGGRPRRRSSAAEAGGSEFIKLGTLISYKKCKIWHLEIFEPGSTECPRLLGRRGESGWPTKQKNEGTPYSQTNCYFSKFKLPGYGAGMISPPRTVRTANRGPLFFISFISAGKPECAFLLFLSPHSASISVVSFRAAQEELIGQRPRGFFVSFGGRKRKRKEERHVVSKGTHSVRKRPVLPVKKKLGTYKTYIFLDWKTTLVQGD